MCYGKLAQAEKKTNFKSYGKRNEVLNALIEKNSTNLPRTRKGGRRKKNNFKTIK